MKIASNQKQHYPDRKNCRYVLIYKPFSYIMVYMLNKEYNVTSKLGTGDLETLIINSLPKNVLSRIQ